MNVARDVLIWSAVAGELLCCLGLVVMRNVYDRLHYVMAASALPPLLVAAAVIVEEDWTQPGINALLIAIALFFAGRIRHLADGRHRDPRCPVRRSNL